MIGRRAAARAGRRAIGQPAARAKRSAIAGSTPAPQPATTSPRGCARTSAARRATSAARRLAARRRHVRTHGAPPARPGASTQRRAGRHERFAERQVEVHRPGGRSDRVRDRARRERAPPRVRLGIAGLASGGPGSWNQRTEPPKRRGLVDRLARAPVAQLGGRSAVHTSSGTRAWCASTTAGCRFTAAVPDVQHTIAGRPVARPTPSARNPAERSSSTTSTRSRPSRTERERQRRVPRARRHDRGGDPAADPFVDERPRERGRHIDGRSSRHNSRRATMAACREWCSSPGSRRPPRRGAASRQVLRRDRARWSRSTCPTRDDVRRDRDRDRDAGQARGVRRATRWAAGSRLRLALDRPELVTRARARERDAPGSRTTPQRRRARRVRRGAGRIGRARRGRRVPRALARATDVRDRPRRRARPAPSGTATVGALPRALPPGARRGRDGTDVGPALRAADAGRARDRHGRREVREDRARDARTHARRRRARAPRRRSRAAARTTRGARRLHRVVRGPARRHTA